MKSITLAGLVLLAALYTRAEEPTAPTPPPAETTAEAKALTWNELIQKKYNLTDEQMKTLSDTKLPEPHTVRVAHMANASGKSIEEVLKMRTEEKLGWGQIAKRLNVPEKEIGQSVSSLRKQRNDEVKREQTAQRKKQKEDREKKREEMKAKHEEKREELKAKREEKREEMKAKRDEKKDDRTARKDNGRGRNK